MNEGLIAQMCRLFIKISRAQIIGVEMSEHQEKIPMVARTILKTIGWLGILKYAVWTSYLWSLISSP